MRRLEGEATEPEGRQGLAAAAAAASAAAAEEAEEIEVFDKVPVTRKSAGELQLPPTQPLSVASIGASLEDGSESPCTVTEAGYVSTWSPVDSGTLFMCSTIVSPADGYAGCQGV
jgi:hypothetical protein